MRLREIFATNLSVSPKPVRLRCRQGLNEFALPAELGPPLIMCVRALLYPHDVEPVELEEVAGNDRFECGMVLHAGEEDFRVRRGLSPQSMRLQIVDERGRFEDLAKGLEEVSRLLSMKVGLPPGMTFEVFNLGNVAKLFTGAVSSLAAESWDVKESGLEDFSWEESGLDDKGIHLNPAQITRLREEYTRAVELEAVDSRIDKLTFEIRDVDGELAVITGDDTELGDIRHRLTQMEELDELTDRDWSVLEDPAQQLRTYERRLNVLGQRLMKLRDKPKRVPPVWKNPIFVAGTGLAVFCTAMALFAGLRPMALGNTVGLACTLVGFLQFMREKEELATRGEREALLEHESLEVEDERDEYEQRLAAVRRRYRVETAEELRAQLDKREALVTRERELLNLRREAYKDQQYVAISAKRHRMQEQMDELRTRRAELGTLTQTSVQIARELQKMGIPLVDSAAAGEGGGFMDAQRSTVKNPFPYLRDMANEMGLGAGVALDGVTTSLWGRMLGRLLNREVPTPQVSETGEFRAVAEEPSWDLMNLPQRWLSVESLCLALIMRSVGRIEGAPLPLLFRSYPMGMLSESEKTALREVYRSLASHLQLVLFNEAA